MASQSNFNRELNLVLLEGDSFCRKVVLNRPNKLNSLNYEMVIQLIKTFRTLEMDSAVKLVILKANGKAFCAGGDVTSTLSAMADGRRSFGARFYERLFNLGYFLATYKKPLVPLIDGIVMGGGAGLTLNGRFRIVTEKAVFAAPEVFIGLFPDVGASHFLSGLPGHFGEFLGLTGARLDGAEMLACGLATHFVLSKDLPSLENELQNLTSTEISSINEIISSFAQKPKIRENSSFKSLEVINKCFSKDTVEEILLALENEVKNKEENWIVMAIKSMNLASRISLKIALRSIREGRMQNLSQCLIREYTICGNIVRATVSGDLYEGARAKLFDKDNKPKWEPSKLELVSNDMVDRCFSGIDDDDDWKYLQLSVRYNIIDIPRPKF